MVKEKKLALLDTCLLKFIPLALVLISVTVAMGAYLQALSAPFIGDDVIYITNNSKLAGIQFTDLWKLLSERFNDLEYLPVRDFSYWLDISLFGQNPSAFRIHNILLYLLCCLLVYSVTLKLWQYFRPMEAVSAQWAAAVVTALFTIHPAHVEAVVWVSGRKDLLSSMFSMFALWLALNAKQEQGLSYRFAIATLIILLAAIFSKATSVMVAPIIALLWFAFLRDIPILIRRRLQLLWPVAILLLAVCTLVNFTSKSLIKFLPYYGFEAITRALAILGWSARLAISPESRHFFYPVLETHWLTVLVALGAAVLLGAIAGVIMLLGRRWPLEGFALVAFVLFCIPYMQIIPFETNSLASDRFIFLAVWPVLLLAVSLVWHCVTWRGARMVLLLGISFPWIYQTIERPKDWLNPGMLLDVDFHAYPGHYQPASFRIIYLLERGLYREAIETANTIENADIKNIMDKLIQADIAVEKSDDAAAASPQEAINRLLDLGGYLETEQIPAQAKWNNAMAFVYIICRSTVEREWKLLAKKFPNNLLVNYSVGMWLVGYGNYTDGVDHLRFAIESQKLPEVVRGVALKYLGIALFNTGRYSEAENSLRSALVQLKPDIEAYCILSALYRRTGRIGDAERADTECRTRVPSWTQVQ